MRILSHDNLTPRTTSRKKNEKTFLAWPGETHLVAVGTHGVVTGNDHEFIIEINDYPGRELELYTFMKGTRVQTCERVIRCLEPFAGKSDIVDDVLKAACHELKAYEAMEDQS